MYQYCFDAETSIRTSFNLETSLRELAIERRIYRVANPSRLDLGLVFASTSPNRINIVHENGDVNHNALVPDGSNVLGPLCQSPYGDIFFCRGNDNKQ